MSPTPTSEADEAPVIIDVREPAEFRELHLDDAVNIPSSRYQVADFEPFRRRTIRLICNSGRRARLVKAELDAAAFPRVEICAVQMQSYGEGGAIGVEGSWTLDRQLRLTLGVLLLVALLGAQLVSPWFLTIAGVVAVGLTFTAVIDRCYLKMIIANLPWNRCAPAPTGAPDGGDPQGG